MTIASLAALALCAPMPLLADQAEKQAREVRSGWIVVPSPPAAAPVTVAKGEYALRQKVVPLGYATSDAEAADADGKVLLPAGVPLMRLMGQGYVACLFGERERSGWGNFLMGLKGGDTRICLRDADGDGRFEGFVHYSGGLVQGLPSVNGRLPKELHPLKAPVAYTMHRPADAPGDYFMAIRYEGHALLGGRPVFIDAFGHGKDVGTLDRAWPRTDEGKGKLAQTGRVLLNGAVLDVTADDPDHVTLSVLSSFPAGIFGVTQRGQNGFY